jgi:hypothetical protein
MEDVTGARVLYNDRILYPGDKTASFFVLQRTFDITNRVWEESDMTYQFRTFQNVSHLAFQEEYSAGTNRNSEKPDINADHVAFVTCKNMN